MISIIIPTFNRVRSLVETLASVTAHPLSTSDYEVIVVDNGSTDGTADAVRMVSTSNPGRAVRYVYEASPGLLAARHRGVEESFGDLLTFVDDDVSVSDSWLTSIGEAFEDPGVLLVGGPCLPLYEAQPPTWLDGLWTDVGVGRVCPWLSLLDLGRLPARVDPNLIWGLNFSIRRETLYQLGGFHPDLYPPHLERFTGDGETGLTLKLQSVEKDGYYVPGAGIMHRVPRSRLSVSYLEGRARYAGIARSFTEARRRDSVPMRSSIKAAAATALHGMFTVARRDALDPLRRRLKKTETVGFLAHQHWMRTDPDLRAWVQRPHYFGAMSSPHD